VIGQFAVSIGLIICTAVVYAQTIHARTADPGFRREGLLQIEGIAGASSPTGSARWSGRIERVPGVTGVGRTTIGVATKSQINTVVQVPGRSEPVIIGNYLIDEVSSARWASRCWPGASSAKAARSTVTPPR
jgi:putative ABC transport system permease protein